MERTLLQGTVLAGIVATAARRAHALTSGGALAAVVVGSAVYAGMGVRGSAALFTFFASSAALGHLPGSERGAQSKGRERDAWQVAANGGVPAVIAATAIAARPSAPVVCAYYGAIAAAAADTWATEIGSRYGGAPRSLTTLQRLEPGVSGGVSIAGSAASAAGAATIAWVASAPLRPLDKRQIATIVMCGGVSGSFLDSLLGATLQEIRFCDACKQETELSVHTCQLPTRHLRGLAWCDNDVVNALAITSGALVASLLAMQQIRNSFQSSS